MSFEEVAVTSPQSLVWCFYGHSVPHDNMVRVDEWWWFAVLFMIFIFGDEVIQFAKFPFPPFDGNFPLTVNGDASLWVKKEDNVANRKNISE